MIAILTILSLAAGALCRDWRIALAIGIPPWMIWAFLWFGGHPQVQALALIGYTLLGAAATLVAMGIRALSRRRPHP